MLEEADDMLVGFNPGEEAEGKGDNGDNGEREEVDEELESSRVVRNGLGSPRPQRRDPVYTALLEELLEVWDQIGDNCNSILENSPDLYGMFTGWRLMPVRVVASLPGVRLSE